MFQIGRGWATDLQRRVNCLERDSARIVERQVGGRVGHAPHLIPHLKVPARDDAQAVPVQEVLTERLNEVMPLLVVRWRRGQAFVGAAVAERVCSHTVQR